MITKIEPIDVLYGTLHVIDTDEKWHGGADVISAKTHRGTTCPPRYPGAHSFSLYGAHARAAYNLGHDYDMIEEERTPEANELRRGVEQALNHALAWLGSYGGIKVTTRTYAGYNDYQCRHRGQIIQLIQVAIQLVEQPDEQPWGSLIITQPDSPPVQWRKQ